MDAYATKKGQGAAIETGGSTTFRSFPDNLSPFLPSILSPHHGFTISHLQKHWILGHNDFLSWLNCTGPAIMNLWGAQGSGKSFTSGLIYYHLKQLRSPEAETESHDKQALSASTPVAYYSCDAYTPTVGKLLASILYQVLSQDESYFEIFKNESWRTPHQYEFEQCVNRCFQEMLSPSAKSPKRPGPVIIIDGFDSCDAVTEREAILNYFVSAASQPHAVFKMILTSTEPLSALQSHPTIAILQEHDAINEIQRAVREEISKLVTQGRIVNDFQERITEKLIMKAHRKGLLMAKLLVQEIESMRVPSTPVLINLLLDQLPEDIEELYHRKLERVNSISRGWAADVLLWLSLATRPLLQKELEIALAISTTGHQGYSSRIEESHLSIDLLEDLRQILGGLVYTTGSYVALVHQSLREFLTSEHIQCANNDWYRIKDVTAAHKEIARICVIFLAVNTEENFGDGGKTLYGWQYASDAWIEHFHRGMPEAEVRFEHLSDCQNLVSLLVAAVLLDCSDAVRILIGRQDVQRDVATKQYKFWLLHLAATHGHSEIVKILLNHLDLVGGDKMNDEGQYPLHLASLKGHVEVVKLLLDANIPVDQKNRDSETALHVAAKWGYEAVVKELLNAQRKDTAAHTVNDEDPEIFSHGREGVAEAGNDSNPNGNDGNDVSEEEDEADGTDVEADGSDSESDSVEYETPLHLAAANGHTRIVELLIEFERSRLNAAWTMGTPLHMAVEHQRLEVVETLIRHKVDLNRRLPNGWSPLHIACRHGNMKILSALLKAKANVNLRTTNGSSALSIAAESGNADAVKLLIKHAANPNGENTQGIGPLYRAVASQCVDVVDVLLKAYADPFAVGKYPSKSPLRYAQDSGMDEIVALIKKRGVSFLIAAARGGDFRKVQEVIDSGVDVNGQDENGRTALFWACISKNVNIIKMLYEHNADYTILDKDKRGCFDVVMDHKIILLFQELYKDKPGTEVMRNDDGRHCWNNARHTEYSLYCDVCMEDITGYLYHCCACGCNTPGRYGYDVCLKCFNMGRLCMGQGNHILWKGFLTSDGILSLWRSESWKEGEGPDYLFQGEEVDRKGKKIVIGGRQEDANDPTGGTEGETVEQEGEYESLFGEMMEQFLSGDLFEQEVQGEEIDAVTQAVEEMIQEVDDEEAADEVEEINEILIEVVENQGDLETVQGV